MFVSIGLDILLLEVGVAVGDADGGYGAVAVEMDVVFVQRGKAVVRLNAVKRAGDVGWDCAGDFEVEDGAFESRGGVHRPEGVCFREGDLFWGGELIVAVVWGGVDVGGEVEDVCHFFLKWFVYFLLVAMSEKKTRGGWIEEVLLFQIHCADLQGWAQPRKPSQKWRHPQIVQIKPPTVDRMVPRCRWGIVSSRQRVPG